MLAVRYNDIIYPFMHLEEDFELVGLILGVIGKVTAAIPVSHHPPLPKRRLLPFHCFLGKLLG